jgi:CheY-like chemotaxis protein
VLVVDDNSVNRTLLQTILSKWNLQVRVAADGHEAVSLVENQRFNLIFMDCQMPRMDGFEATRRIRALESPSSPRIPVIAITASAMSGDKERCLAAGMDDYLSKPFARAELERLILRYIGPGK